MTLALAAAPGTAGYRGETYLFNGAAARECDGYDRGRDAGGNAGRDSGAVTCCWGT